MEKIHERRIEELRKKIKEKGIDGYLVLYAANRFYLTGFELHDPQCNESAGCVVVSLKDVWLCTDSRYTEAAKNIFPDERIFVYKQRLDDLVAFIKGLNIKELGFEANILTYDLYEKLKDNIVLRPFKNGLVEELRAVKDEKEISAIKKAALLNHRLFDNLRSRNLIGEKERDLAWEIEMFYKKNGAQELAFPSIVASGSNSALPHYVTSEEIIRNNEILLIDVGCRVDGYCCDHTRTFWMGEECSERFDHILGLVKKAQEVALKKVRAGIKAKDLFNEVMDFFKEHNVSESFVHSLGHGVGLEAHELPSLGPRSENILEENMVITIEPGLYFPGWGGVRWEDMVVVKSHGYEVI